MELNRLTREADDLIRKVVSRYNQLYVPAGSISQVELDLMLDDLRKLYDTFKNIGQANLKLQHNLKKPESAGQQGMITEKQDITAKTTTHIYDSPKTAQPKQEEREPEPVAKAEAELLQDAETIPVTGNAAEPEVSRKIDEEPALPDEEVVKEESGILQNKESTEVVPDETSSVDTEPTRSMLADTFNPGSKSLSETLASTQGVVGTRLQYQPITDLATGIGLNDKFSFISELFDNNSVQYEEAITRINKAVNLDEANWILQKYHSSAWGHKHETLARLKEFIRRRFI